MPFNKCKDWYEMQIISSLIIIMHNISYLNNRIDFWNYSIVLCDIYTGIISVKFEWLVYRCTSFKCEMLPICTVIIAKAEWYGTITKLCIILL